MLARTWSYRAGRWSKTSVVSRTMSTTSSSASTRQVRNNPEEPRDDSVLTCSVAAATATVTAPAPPAGTPPPPPSGAPAPPPALAANGKCTHLQCQCSTPSNLLKRRVQAPLHLRLPPQLQTGKSSGMATVARPCVAQLTTEPPLRQLRLRHRLPCKSKPLYRSAPLLTRLLRGWQLTFSHSNGTAAVAAPAPAVA
jgi:hypothetical protein